MTPGSQPFVELESALLRVAIQAPESLLDELKGSDTGLVELVNRLLPPDDGDLFLLIDQFEEIFTLVQDETERALFLNSLIAATNHPQSRIRIVVTLRADFYDRPLLYPEFGNLIRKRTEIILPLTSTEMEQAIVGPADRIGMRFEPGLVSAIVSDVSQQHGSLPLLQFALTELFERREGYNLTQAAYQESGGVLGALARKADELYDQLDVVSQEVARQMFLRLVSLGDSTEDTKRRILQAEFINGIPDNKQVARDVLDKFLRQRLLTADYEPQTRAPTIEIAHEALIRVWERLHNWLDTNRDELRLYQRLGAATGEWLNTGRDPSFLASGARLSQFENILSAKTLSLRSEEIDYLEASIAARKRAANRVRLFITGLVIFSLIALALALFALDRQQTAEIERNRADTQANISRSRELAVTALTNVNQTDLALLLSLESLRAADTFEGRNSLLTVLQSQPHIQKYLQGAIGAIRSIAVSPDGNMLIAGGVDNTIYRWDVTTGQPIGEPLTGHTGLVNSVAFSPDGHLIASASADNTVRLWDADTGQPIGDPLSGHSGAVWSVAFSPDGKTLASAGADTTIILWDVESHDMQGQPLTGHQDIVFSLAFSPDGKILASGSGDSTIRLWNVATEQPIGDPLEAPNWVLSLTFSATTGLLASTGADDNVTFWDTATGEQLNVVQTGHENYVRSLTFSPDGRYFATGSQDGTIRLWDARSGDAIGQPLQAHSSEVWSISFIPGHNVIASAGADGNVILWNIDNTQPLSRTLIGHSDDVLSLTFSPDGTLLVSGGGNLSNNDADNTVRVWNLDTDEIKDTDDSHLRYVSSVAFSPDGQTVASGSADQTIHLWNIDSDAIKVMNIPERSDWVALAFSPDGKLLASGSDDGKIYFWDVTSGQLQGEPLVGHTAGVLSLAFSPDGKLLASGSDDYTIIVWDVANRQPLYDPLVGHNDSVTSVAFSPDGQRLASGGHDETIRLWDVNTGEPIGQPLTGHSDWVTGLAFSPDGQTLASTGYDRLLYLWDMSCGERIGNAFTGHTSWINAVAYSPDGQTVATGAHDTTIRLWDVSPESWKKLACEIVNRNLTPAEWERFFQDIPYHNTC